MADNSQEFVCFSFDFLLISIPQFLPVENSCGKSQSSPLAFPNRPFFHLLLWKTGGEPLENPWITPLFSVEIL